jgi:hypothetical protein
VIFGRIWDKGHQRIQSSYEKGKLKIDSEDEGNAKERHLTETTSMKGNDMREWNGGIDETIGEWRAGSENERARVRGRTTSQRLPLTRFLYC